MNREMLVGLILRGRMGQDVVESFIDNCQHGTITL